MHTVASLGSLPERDQLHLILAWGSEVSKCHSRQEAAFDVQVHHIRRAPPAPRWKEQTLSARVGPSSCPAHLWAEVGPLESPKRFLDRPLLGSRFLS